MKQIIKLAMSMILSTLTLCGSMSIALAYTGPATVATDDLNLREGGGLDYNVIDCLSRGAKVTINFDAGYGWYQVTYNGKTGYIAGYYLLLGDLDSAVETPAVEIPAKENAAVETTLVESPVSETRPVMTPMFSSSGNGVVVADEVRLRAGPSMNSETVAFLYTGDSVNVHGMCWKWYEIDICGIVGYVYSDYVSMNGERAQYTFSVATVIDNTAVYTEPVTEETYVAPEPIVKTEKPASVQKTSVPSAPVQTAPVYSGTNGQAIVDTAMQYIGTPYVWGGESLEEGGFDCSGLVYFVYGQHGITLNRVAQAMYANGVDVDLNDLRPGDILLFGSSIYNIWHAGLYVGNGVFIHSPYSGSTVRTQALNQTYGMRLVAARRVV